VGHGSENLSCEFFGKEHGALGLATAADTSLAATERQKVLVAALLTPNSCETSLQPPAIKKPLHRPRDHRAQGTRAGLEAFFIRPHITVKVSFEQLIEPSEFGMSWPISSRRFRQDAAAGIIGRTEIGGTVPGNNRLVAEGHGVS